MLFGIIFTVTKVQLYLLLFFPQACWGPRHSGFKFVFHTDHFITESSIDVILYTKLVVYTKCIKKHENPTQCRCLVSCKDLGNRVLFSKCQDWLSCTKGWCLKFLFMRVRIASWMQILNILLDINTIPDIQWVWSFHFNNYISDSSR